MSLRDTSIAIITYHMIPNTRYWGASQRMYFLANQLESNGAKVSVLHGNYGNYNIYDKVKKYQSYAVDIKPRFIQDYQERMQNTQLKSSESKIHSNRGIPKYLVSVALNYAKKVYRMLESTLYNDFNYIGFIVTFWNRAAMSILKDLIISEETKVVIISGPYFTNFSLIKKIKKNFPHIKVVLDYRDPWNLLKRGSYISRSKERRYIELSDLVVMFSSKFEHDMIKQYSIPSYKTAVVYNGYDRVVWEKMKATKAHRQKSNRMIISYVGSHITFENGSGRDPERLISAVASSENNEKLQLNLVGCNNMPEDLQNAQLAEINYLPIVPHEKALEIMYTSDILIVLGTDEQPSNYTLTGKVFDCISSGNYILGISNDLDVDYVKLIEELNVGVGCKNIITDIRSRLDNCFDLWEKNLLVPQSNTDVYEYSREYQNSILVEKMQSIMAVSVNERQ